MAGQDTHVVAYGENVLKISVPHTESVDGTTISRARTHRIYHRNAAKLAPWLLGAHHVVFADLTDHPTLKPENICLSSGGRTLPGNPHESRGALVCISGLVTPSSHEPLREAASQSSDQPVRIFYMRMTMLLHLYGNGL